MRFDVWEHRLGYGIWNRLRILDSASSSYFEGMPLSMGFGIYTMEEIWEEGLRTDLLAELLDACLLAYLLILLFLHLAAAA